MLPGPSHVKRHIRIHTGGGKNNPSRAPISPSDQHITATWRLTCIPIGNSSDAIPMHSFYYAVLYSYMCTVPLENTVLASVYPCDCCLPVLDHFPCHTFRNNNTTNNNKKK